MSVPTSYFFVKFVLSLVVMLNFIICIILLIKFIHNKKKIQLYLALVDFTIIIGTLTQIHIIFPEMLVKFDVLVKSRIGLFFAGFGNVFLYYTIYYIFYGPTKKIKIITFIISGVFGVFNILILYISLIIKSTKLFNLSLLIRDVYLLAISLNGMFLYYYLFKRSTILKKLVENTIDRKGCSYLQIFSVSAAVFLPLNALVSIPSPNPSLIFGFVWTIAIISTLFAYLGFIFPFQKGTKK